MKVNERDCRKNGCQMSEENLVGQTKKRARYRATFAPDVSYQRGTVHRPEEGEGSVAKGKEVLQEDVKGHDMDWGIGNIGPETLMDLSFEVDAPARIR